MSQFILIDHIKVQNANAVAGFTWGFPAVTHFLGFVHNLSRKLANEKKYNDITLEGCAVVAHEHKIHTYGTYNGYRFTQSRNPPYLKSHDKKTTPPVIEEGKMNMTISLLIGCDGNIGNREEGFLQWLQNVCLLQRLAGGTILDFAGILLNRPRNKNDVKDITRRLSPGFLLLDRSRYLEHYSQEIKEDNPDADLLDAWLDFSMLKQKARPKSDLISKHLQKIIKKNPKNIQFAQYQEAWQLHLQKSYEEEIVPEVLKSYFRQLERNNGNKKLLMQWESYCGPDEKTDADWEYVPKPRPGFLVPIMTGYKAISSVYKNAEVENTRDNKTDVCFAESVHSIGEWQSVHHIKSLQQLQNCLWRYHYEDNWYLCRQSVESENSLNDISTLCENPEDDIFN